jgi:hypothetical protein
MLMSNQPLKPQINLQTQPGTMSQTSSNQSVPNQVLMSNNMTSQQLQTQQGINRPQLINQPNIMGASQIQPQQVTTKPVQINPASNAEDEAYMRKIDELRQHLPRLEKLIAKG